MRLSFGATGELLGELANLIELQIPAVLDIPPWETGTATNTLARLTAAAALRSLAIVPFSETGQIQPKQLEHAVPLVAAAQASELEGLVQRTGAALVVAHHFAKGDSTVKNAVDRVPSEQIGVAKNLPAVFQRIGGEIFGDGVRP